MSAELKENIRNYVSLDDYIRRQNEKLAEYRSQKKYLEEKIMDEIRTKRLENININLPTGSLQFVQRENAAPINIGFLGETLSAYFSREISNPMDAERKAQHCLEFILANRQKRPSQYLKRNFNRDK